MLVDKSINISELGLRPSAADSTPNKSRKKIRSELGALDEEDWLPESSYELF